MRTVGARGSLPLLVAGGLGMGALGALEVWGGRADLDDGTQRLVLLLLVLAPLGVLTGAWTHVHRRVDRTPAVLAGGRARRLALTGWALLSVAAVLLVQAVLFGASSALAQEIGCGRRQSDWCGFGSGIFGALALTLSGAGLLLGSCAVLLARRTAVRPA